MEQFMYFWSWLFSPYIGSALFVVLAGWLFWKRRKIDAFVVGASGIATALGILLVKAVIRRPRPSVDSELWATDASFPSGHAAGAACFFLLAWWFIFSKKQRSRTAPIFLMFAILVGASRLYFDVHYVSDVVAGYVIGAGIAALAIMFDLKHKTK